MAKAKQRLSKKVYLARSSRLRAQLVQLQVELKQAPFKVLLILAGPEGAGRGNLLNTLAEWLDPRGVETFSYHPPTENERGHPHHGRLWPSRPGICPSGPYPRTCHTPTPPQTTRTNRPPPHHS